ERGTIPATDIEGAISAEHQVTDRVARELLAPITDQHLDVAGSHWQVGGVVDLDPGELCRDHATVRGAAGYVRALGAVDPRSALPHRGRAPGGGEGDTAGVEHVDERLARAARLDAETEQPSIPEVVRDAAHVGDDAHRTARARRRLDDSSLLGDEHATVRCELEIGGIDEVVGPGPGPVEVLPLEALRDCTGRGSETEDGQGKEPSDDQPPEIPHQPPRRFGRMVPRHLGNGSRVDRLMPTSGSLRTIDLTWPPYATAS